MDWGPTPAKNWGGPPPRAPPPCIMMGQGWVAAKPTPPPPPPTWHLPPHGCNGVGENPTNPPAQPHTDKGWETWMSPPTRWCGAMVQDPGMVPDWADCSILSLLPSAGPDREPTYDERGRGHHVGGLCTSMMNGIQSHHCHCLRSCASRMGREVARG